MTLPPLSLSQVSSTVKAFMHCDLPGELIELLERIVLQVSDVISDLSSYLFTYLRPNTL